MNAIAGFGGGGRLDVRASARVLKRATSIEPVFRQIKHNRGITRLKRRGSAAARSEWRLISATHNLLKLHNHWIAPAAG